MTIRKRWTVIAALAALACACSTEEKNGAGGSGGGSGGGDTDGSGGAAGGNATLGVSKRPWVLAVDGTSAVIRWEADRADTDPNVKVAPEDGGDSKTVLANVSEFVVENSYFSPFNPDAPPDEAGTYWMHEARIDSLDPGTCYRYELSEKATHDGRFCTAQPSGAPLRFLAVADTNPGLGLLGALWPHVTSRGFDFTIHAGDVQYYDSTFETWALWFPEMTPMLKQGAFFPSIGNHELEKEDEYDAYYKRFFGGAGFDGTDAYYRFHTGGVYFFTLNTEEPISAGEAQAAWIEAQLADAAAQPGYRFSVVYFHKPFITCGDKSQNSAARNLLEPIFEQYGVELVVQGHMHGYERFEVPKSSGTGTLTYVTTGGGGSGLGDVDENLDRETCSLRIMSGKFHEGVIFDVTTGQLAGTVIDRDGAVRDEFSKSVP